MLQPVSVAQKNLADYASIVGRPLVEEIQQLAKPLAGKRILHLSATAFGGGVDARGAFPAPPVEVPRGGNRVRVVSGGGEAACLTPGRRGG